MLVLRQKRATRARNPGGLPTHEPNKQHVGEETLDLMEKVIGPQIGSLEKGFLNCTMWMLAARQKQLHYGSG